MKTWKGYNLLDFILISVGVITVSISGILFKSKWFIITSTMLGLLYVFTQAKGKIATQFLGIIYFCFYILICYTQKYYGEALLYLTIMLPMYIYGVIHWLSNKAENDNVIIVRGSLSKKEIYIAGICFVFVSVGVFVLFKALNTAQLIINCLSFLSMLPAIYLLIRRCKWNQVAFLVNDFIVPLLWLALVLQGDLSFLPVCIYHIFQITYDVYGLTQWIKLEKQQKQN